MIASLGEPYTADDGETVQQAVIVDGHRWRVAEGERQAQAKRARAAASRKSRRLTEAQKEANALARAEKREQARLEREQRKAEKRAAREALAATRKIEREKKQAEKAKAKTDKAIERLSTLTIAPTDDYKVRSSAVMRGAHAIARLAVDGGSTLPYRKEMGAAMRALWGRLKAGETILGGDYLPAVEGAVEATVEPVDAIDEIDAITLTTPRDAIDDIDDELGASDFYGLI